MNKKILALLSSVVLTAGVLVGCGNSSKGMQDGTYNAEFDKFDDHGWKGQVSITVASGKISEAKFDYVNEAGKLKSEDADYQATMTSVSGVGPVEFTKKYSDAIVEKQSAEIDVVTGATTSHNDCKTLVQAAIDNANAGKSETAVVSAK
ncbi:MAG: FMN-binding protein [Clostridium sp.]|nr:FMN-binding protein [Clostridium sp.]